MRGDGSPSVWAIFGRETKNKQGELKERGIEVDVELHAVFD